MEDPHILGGMREIEFNVILNSDEQNRNLAFQKILDEVVSKNRKQGLDFYRLYTKDDPFKQAFIDSMRRMVSVQNAINQKIIIILI